MLILTEINLEYIALFVFEGLQQQILILVLANGTGIKCWTQFLERDESRKQLDKTILVKKIWKKQLTGFCRYVSKPWNTNLQFLSH